MNSTTAAPLSFDVTGSNAKACRVVATAICDQFFEGQGYSLDLVRAWVDERVKNITGDTVVITFGAEFVAHPHPAAAGDTPPVA